MTESRGTILIVDDEESIREGISAKLRLEGFSCVTAADGKKALETASTQDFDIVLLDVKMPGMSGLDVLPRIVTDYPDTAVIMLSAMVDTESAVEAMRLGAYDYITKPVALTTLTMRIENTLERRGLSLERRSYQRRWADIVLQQSEKTYRSLFEYALDSMAVVNPDDMRVLLCNQSCARLYGFASPDEVIGLSVFHFVHPNNREQFLSVIEEVLHKRPSDTSSSDTHQTYESLSMNNSGQEMWIKTAAIKVDYQGSPAVLISACDITDRKRAEDETIRTINYLDAIINSATDFYIATSDLKGSITSWNKGAELIMGYAADEVVGKMNVSQLVSQEAVASGVLGKGAKNLLKQGSITVETEFSRKDGQVFPALLNVTQLKDGHGTIMGTLAIVQDITEYKHAENKLRQEKAYTESVVSSIPEMVITIDANRNVTYVNDAFAHFLGVDLKVLKGRQVDQLITEFNLIPPESAAIIIERIKQRLQTGDQISSVELEMQNSEGEKVPVTYSASGIKGRDGEVLGEVVIIQDITERKRTEIEREGLLNELEMSNGKLKQSNQELQDFVYIASHDLREPLRKISSFGGILVKSLEGKLDEDQQENFSYMINGANRMQQMIDALLLYSRITTRAKPFSIVDLNEVLHDIKELELAFQLEETRGKIEAPALLPLVVADSTQIHQLLHNLISNSLKYHKSGETPRITIQANTFHNNMIRVEVADNGIGIDHGYQDDVFTMFRRLHSQSEYEGTGIGLAVCKKIVQRHGGEIGVESTLGQGSTFWFTIPSFDYHTYANETENLLVGNDLS